MRIAQESHFMNVIRLQTPMIFFYSLWYAQLDNKLVFNQDCRRLRLQTQHIHLYHQNYFLWVKSDRNRSLNLHLHVTIFYCVEQLFFFVFLQYFAVKDL